MKKLPLLTGLLAAILILGGAQPGAAWYHVSFDFNTSWATDYAPGWENSAYRHGPAPVGRMMEYVAGGVGGTGGMRLIADSTPESWMWWAAVNPVHVGNDYMTKQYDPWVSVDYFDEGWDAGAPMQRTGQLYAVPSWVNPYIDPGEDWTDIQFGARFNQPPPNDNYYFAALGENHPGWQDTGVSRVNNGWVNLKMQLSSADGKVHFYINNSHVGSSYRDDYVDLIGMGLYNMFEAPLADWGAAKPSVIYDNFEFGSTAVPEPTSLLLMGLGLAAVGLRRRRQK